MNNHTFANLAACHAYASTLKKEGQQGLRFTEVRAALIIHSLVRALTFCRENVTIGDLMRLESKHSPHREMKWMKLKQFIQARGHLPAKNWSVVKEGVKLLREIVGQPGSALFDGLFPRVLNGGKWHLAAEMANVSRRRCEQRAESPRPWVVLIMGCNGIRKTTSVHQKWFKEALSFSLGRTYTGDIHDLPDGNNSFFRQLDYMMSNVANAEFARLYQSSCCKFKEENDLEDEEAKVRAYMAVKDGIFARYRGLCEMLGGLLMESASERSMNVMLETSGKDIASFHYVNYFFPDERYQKLVINFDVDDIKFAKNSVNHRMKKEMELGYALISKKETTVNELMAVNCGGPYGGDQLDAVKQAADATWKQVMSSLSNEKMNPNTVTTSASAVLNNNTNKATASSASVRSGDDSSDMWSSWYFAKMEINGSMDHDNWSCRSVGVKDGGSNRKSECYTTFDRNAVLHAVAAVATNQTNNNNGTPPSPAVLNVDRPKKRIKR